MMNNEPRTFAELLGEPVEPDPRPGETYSGPEADERADEAGSRWEHHYWND